MLGLPRFRQGGSWGTGLELLRVGGLGFRVEGFRGLGFSGLRVYCRGLNN